MSLRPASKEEAVHKLRGRKFHQVGATMEKVLHLGTVDPTFIGSSTCKKTIFHDWRRQPDKLVVSNKS